MSVPGIIIEGPVGPEYMLTLKMNAGLNNFRPIEKQFKALVQICGFEDGRIYIAKYDNEIVGYVTFHRPDRYSRWFRHPSVIELGGVEVTPGWRSRGVGTELLKYAFSDNFWEGYIIITTEYFRHWDIARTGLDIWDYRKMLDRFFGKVGFMAVSTNDPDIMEHPVNVLMARVGSRVCLDDMMAFDDLCNGR